MKKQFGIDIRPTSEQLSIASRKKYINNRVNFPYNKDDSELGHKVSNEKEYNFAKILQYLSRKYEYESQYFQLKDGTIVIPKFYDVQRNLFYFFISDDSTKSIERKLFQLKNEQNIRIHFVNRKKYIRILSFFSNKIKFSLNDAFSFNEMTIIKHIVATDRKCLICGNDLNVAENKYCSKQCWNKAKEKFVKSNCLNCHKEFSLSALEKSKNYKLFCSDECQIQYEQKMKDGLVSNKYHTMPYQEFECKQCHKKFKTFARKASYCSLQCANDAKKNNNKKECICKECGKYFVSYQRNPKFCSTSCASKFNSRKQGFGIAVRPKTIWNTGLDKTDSRIQKSVQKQKKTFAKHMAEGKIKMYFQGKHLTDEHKRHCSIAQSRALRNGKRTFGSKRMNGLDLKVLGYRVRSYWEFNFALMLRYVNKQYEYEPTTFVLLNGKTYTPDFYVVKNNTYYEVKGYWYAGSKEKFQQFKKEYPHIKIKLIERKQYFRLLNYFLYKIKNLYLTKYQLTRKNNHKIIG